MDNLKKKQEEEAKKLKTVPKGVFVEKGAPAPEVSWEDAIGELKGQTFNTEDEAVYAVIDKVIDKVGSAETPREELREFLYTLFDTDPEMKEQIKTVLKA